MVRLVLDGRNSRAVYPSGPSHQRGRTDIGEYTDRELPPITSPPFEKGGFGGIFQERDWEPAPNIGHLFGDHYDSKFVRNISWGLFLERTRPQTPAKNFIPTQCRYTAASGETGSRGHLARSGGPARNPSTAGTQPAQALRVRA